MARLWRRCAKPRGSRGGAGPAHQGLAHRDTLRYPDTVASAISPDGAGDVRRDPNGPHHIYPEPLTAEGLEEMDRVLPDEVTAAHLRWLETGEGGPWGDFSG